MSGPVHYGYESLYLLLRPKGGLIAGDMSPYSTMATPCVILED